MNELILPHQMDQSQELAFYRGFLHGSEDWEYVHHASGTCIYVSPAVHGISGYNPENFYQDPTLLEKMIHPEDLSTFQQGRAQLSQASPSLSIEHRILTKTGQVKWVRHRCHLTYFSKRSVSGIRGSIQAIPQRDACEQESKKHQDALQALLNATGESAFLIDVEANLLAMNNISAERLGGHPEDFLGKCIYDFLPPEVAESRKAFGEHVIATGQPAVLLDQRNGMILENRVYPVLNDRGEVYKIAIFSKDNTEKKRAEKALKASEQKFKILFASSPDAILLAERNSGIIVDANQAASDLFETDLSEIIGKHQSELHPTEQKQQAETTFHYKPPALDQEAPPVEIEIVTAGNHRKIVEIRGRILSTDDQEYVLGTFRDITNAKKLEQELTSSQAELLSHKERLEQTLVGTSAGTFIHDFSKGVIVYDEMAQNLLGIEKGEVKPEEWNAVIHPDDLPAVAKIFQAGIGQEAKHINMDYRVRSRHGRWRHIQVKTIINYQDHIPVRTYGLIIDITDQKHLEKDLIDALRAKDRLLSILSHDLRAPFASIKGAVDVIADSLEEEEDSFMKRMVFLLQSTAENTSSLLENLLMWARAQRDKLIFQPEEFPLSEIAREAMRLPTLSAAQKKIQLLTDLKSDAMVHADKQMMLVVIRNLLSNAIKFTPEGGTITISIRPTADGVALSVADTGLGMSEEQLSKLFQLEHASSQKGTQGERGSGFGLLLCDEFVRKNRGAIEVESTLEIGTVFRIILPRVHGHVTEAVPPAPLA